MIVVMLLGVIIGNLVLAANLTSRLAGQASVVNEAGKQRYRVQRIALQADQFIHAEEAAARDDIRSILRSMIDDLSVAAFALDHMGALGLDLSDTRLAQLDTIQLEEQLEEYSDWARLVLEAADRETTQFALGSLIAAEPTVLDSADKVVSIFTDVAGDMRDQAITTYRIASLLGAVIVGLSVAFIVVPLSRDLRRESVRLAISEAGAKEAARRYESLFMDSPDGLLVVDERGLITSANANLQSMFEYGSEELVGRSVEMLIPDRFRQGHQAKVASFFANPARRQLGSGLEVWARHKDGSEFNVDIWLGSVQSIEGVSVLAIVRDITERRRAERELEAFASVAAHDLHEPLRKIQAFGDRLETVAEGRLPEKGEDYLSRMLGATERMRALVDNLLAYARVGVRTEPFQRIDLNEVADNALEDLDVLLKETGGRVYVGDLPEIVADRTTIERLFLNLISNGLKYHRSDVSPVVEVEAELLVGRGWGDPELCRLTVRDNGIGIDEEYLDRIFYMFERLHGRSEFPGTGLGLAVCKRIVDLHLGDITVSSVPGEGSSFVVTLPVDQLSDSQLST